MVKVGLLLLAIAMVAPAWAATAYFVGQRVGTSVTGQAINICTYQYGGQQFEKAFPIGTMCPMSVEVI